MNQTLKAAWTFDCAVVLLQLPNSDVADCFHPGHFMRLPDTQTTKKRHNEDAISYEICSPGFCQEPDSTNPLPLSLGFGLGDLSGSMHQTLKAAWTFDYTVVLLRLPNPETLKKQCNDTVISYEIYNPDDCQKHAITNPSPQNPVPVFGNCFVEHHPQGMHNVPRA